MKAVNKNALRLLYLVALTGSADSLRMTVKVTVIPTTIVTTILPLCQLSLLQTFQSLLTQWVNEATTALVPDFNIPRPLQLVYYNAPHRRLRTRATRKPTSRKTTNPKAVYYPQSCSTCSSAGCATYCGRASCTLCSSSRRHLASDIHSTYNSSEFFENDIDMRDLVVDFSTLGPEVSTAVQALARNFLANNLFDVIGCLGNPLLFQTNVTFLVK